MFVAKIGGGKITFGDVLIFGALLGVCAVANVVYAAQDGAERIRRWWS
jgi:hypothetical protein